MTYENNRKTNSGSRTSIVYYGPLSSVFINPEKYDIILDCREIMDVKTLLSNVSLKGKIKNVDGLLVDSMKKGKKMVLKNIDHKGKIFSLLKPIIEKRCYNDLKAHPNFELSFTAEEIFKNKNLSFEGPFQMTLNQLWNIEREYIMANFPMLNMNTLFTEILDMQSTDNITKDFYIKFKSLTKNKFESRHKFYSIFSLLFISKFEQNKRNELSEKLRTFLSINNETNEFKFERRDFISTKGVSENTPLILTAIEHRIPTLLIGETGTGKTSLIQEIHKTMIKNSKVNSNLEIVNISSDTDIQDLLGSYESGNVDSINNQKFVFKKGPLVKAAEKGDWILLDEINLASKETLDAICAIIEKGEIFLLDSGCMESIKFHDNFRLFACMNPANDHGKKNFRNECFTEIYFDDFSKCINELSKISNVLIYCDRNIKNQIFLKNMNCIITEKKDFVFRLEHFSNTLVRFFIDLKIGIETNLLIGNYLTPILSGRTFVRFLKLIPIYDLNILICLFFYSQFSRECYESLKNIETKYFNHLPPIVYNPAILICENNYFIIKKTKKQLALIDCAIKANLPVLLQGPTSTGKTSVIKFFADLNKIKLHRINNHEHIEAGDYLGNHICDERGNIVFREGILIKAMRLGEWIILDELNLAPSDVLEVLNRLLDDNKEIVLNGDIVKAHDNFRFFATQNLNYGGRKTLSRAFRNRFVEIYFEKFTSADLEEILKKRGLPALYIQKMIQVYEFLDHSRSLNNLITIRDLFKWCSRNIGTLEDLFIQGLMIISERQRNIQDKELILNAFEKTFKIDRNIYINYLYIQVPTYEEGDNIENDYFFTPSTVALYNCLQEALKQKEPVLIIGDTGIGKTKIIDILAMHNKNKLITLPMHQHIDNIDFVGSFTIPFAWIDGSLVRAMKNGSFFLIDEINLAEDSVLEGLNSVFESTRELFVVENDALITANNKFNIFACMNPGNDYGKKELTPALRNRFTEIYFEINDAEKFSIFTKKLYKEIEDLHFCNTFIQLFEMKFMSIKNTFNKDFSIRKLNDIVETVKAYKNNFNDLICIVVKEKTVEWIFDEIFDLGNTSGSGWDVISDNILTRNVFNFEKLNSEISVGVFPFMMKINYLKTEMPVISITTQKNIRKILKAMILNKPILLQGKPGVGKTSFIKQIAELLSIKTIRINLSNDTEMSDLCGNYIPIQIDNETEIRFIESEMVNMFRTGGWVILDEINLASQSVIEGLNSVLDYRKELFINESVKLNEKTRIFATMNDSDINNGRKQMPKSFLDRFTIIKMDEYNEEDINFIVSQKTVFKTEMNLFNQIDINNKYKLMNKDDINLYCTELYLNKNFMLSKVQKYTKKTLSLRKGLLFARILIDDEEDITYLYKDNRFIFCTSLFMVESFRDFEDSYVILHSERNNLLQGIKCCLENIPLIIHGNTGKTQMLEFIAKFLGYEIVTIYCHEEMDNGDIIGQYEIEEEKIFWRDSFLIENLKQSHQKKIIVFDKPETVNKSVLDRLNPLFENERIMNVYEKGIDTDFEIDSNIRFVFLCDNLHGLSSAILDRFWITNLNDHYDFIDNCKLNNINIQDNSLKKQKILKVDTNYDLIIQLIQHTDYNNIFKFDTNLDRSIGLYWIYNTLEENKIDKMFNFYYQRISLSEEEQTIYKLDNFEKLHDFYKNINFNVKKFHDDCSKINSLTIKFEPVEKIINFMKNGRLSFMQEHPKNIVNFKYEVIMKLKKSNIAEFKEMRMLCDSVKDFNIEQYDQERDNFYFNFLDAIIGKNTQNIIFDPINLFKIKSILNYNKKLDEIKNEINFEFKNLYKYGKSNLENVIKKFQVSIKDYNDKCKEFDLKICTRNWKQFIINSDHEDIYQCIKASTYYSDITDYELLFQYENKELNIQHNSLYYLYFIVDNIQTQNEFQMLVDIIKKYKIKMNSEFCKTLINKNNILLYNEMIMNENEIYEIETDDLDWLKSKFTYNPNWLNNVLENMFCEDNIYKVTFIPNYCCRLSDQTFDLISGIDILKDTFYNKSLFINTECLFDHMKDKKIVMHYQKMKKLLEYDFNYAWYIILYMIEFTLERITEYLLNSKIYQFLERQIFIEEFVSNFTNNDLLYNVSLQYRAFLIFEKSERIKNTLKTKIFADPFEIKKYIRFLNEETINHISQVKYEDDEFFCCCRYSCNYNLITFNRGIGCRYENVDWTLFDKLIFREYCISEYFYNRSIIFKYTREEITLAKVFNEYIQTKCNLKVKYVFIIENLLKLYIDEKPCLNLLKMISTFINKNKQFIEQESTCDGVKDGTGDKNISEKIEDEEEIEKNDCFDEKTNIDDQDGVEMSNEGDFEDIEGSCDEESEISEVKGCEEKLDEESCNEDNISENDNENDGFNDEQNNSDEIESEDNEDIGSIESCSTEESNISEENICKYQMLKPDTLNDEQTCNVANDYDLHVKGDGDQKNALDENLENNDFVQGTGQNIEKGHNLMETNKLDLARIYEESDSSFFDLVNSLRIILEGNIPNKYIGNYKTGKRINMRKIVPFILSGFTKDKIWLRRRKMEKRDYRVRIFVDASKSMASEDILSEIFKIFRKITGAFKVLEIDLELYEFGSKILKYENTSDFLTNIKFDKNETNLDWMSQFNDGINLILTDGIFQIQSEWNNKFGMMIIDKRNIRNLQKILIVDKEIEIRKYLDFLKVRFSLIEDINMLDSHFIEALKEMLKNY